jgi:hypothetical protein
MCDYSEWYQYWGFDSEEELYDFLYELQDEDIQSELDEYFNSINE